MVTIAVDAMGGDHAPKAEVEGSIQAVRALGVKIILVGNQEVVRKELAQGRLPAQQPAPTDLRVAVRASSPCPRPALAR